MIEEWREKKPIKFNDMDLDFIIKGFWTVPSGFGLMTVERLIMFSNRDYINKLTKLFNPIFIDNYAIVLERVFVSTKYKEDAIRGIIKIADKWFQEIELLSKTTQDNMPTENKISTHPYR